MASILTFLVEGLAFSGIGIGVDAIKNAADGSTSHTIVELIVGTNDSSAGLSGATPAIALWNEEGERIGQHASLGHANDGDDVVYTINHNQGQTGSSEAGYIMMSNINDDAICIAAVYVTDDKVNTVVFGDLFIRCGISWYYSAREIGTTHEMPNCFWLDNDGSNGINAKAVSFHLNDVVANPDRVEEYNSRPDAFCGSTPRFSYWGELLPDSEIPTFQPLLTYAVDSQNGGAGADMDIARVLDKETIDKSVSMYQGPLGLKRSLNNATMPPDTAGASIPRMMLKSEKPDAAGRRRQTPSQLSQLVVSPHPKHSATGLCNSSTAWGPDEVSLDENMFCDMQTRKLYPLCDNNTTSDCFELDSKTLMESDGSQEQESDIQMVQRRAHQDAKVYKAVSYW